MRAVEVWGFRAQDLGLGGVREHGVTGMIVVGFPALGVRSVGLGVHGLRLRVLGLQGRQWRQGLTA